jgi:hypothetical protein
VKGWASLGSIVWAILHIVILAIGAFTMDSATLTKAFGDGPVDAVGSSLVATGAAGIVLFLYVRTTDELRHRLEIVTKAGLKTIFRHRAAPIKPEYDSRLAQARRIDVIGWGLSSFREDYGHEFGAWAARAHVRILMVDPDYPSRRHSLADLRDREENRPTGDIRRHVESFANMLGELRLQQSPTFEVRLMRAIPAINMLRADDEIFWGPYLMGQQSRNTPTLLITRGGYFFDVLSSHFDEVWERSEPLRAV